MIEIDERQTIETCERITGRNVVSWDEQRQASLLDDVALGKFNPRQWMPMHKIAGFTRRYGIDVEIEQGEVSYDELKTWNRDMPRTRFAPNGQQVKSQRAFRINPAYAEDLYRLYGTA